MEYDRYGSTISAEYALFLGELTAAYQLRAVTHQGVDGVGTLRHVGLGLIAALLTRAITHTNEYRATLGEAPLRDARDLPYLNNLRQIAIKNLNDLIVKLMTAQARPADLLNRPAGAIGLLLQQRLATPRLTARDSAGRAWYAAKLVALIARDYAYQAYITHQFVQLALEGVELVDIVHPSDPARNFIGIALDLALTTRAGAFHPNSVMQVRRHVPTE